MVGHRFTVTGFRAERTRCFWLIDLIAILQLRAWKDAWLRQFQLGELFVNDGRAALVCSRDSDDVAFREVIEKTDWLRALIRRRRRAHAAFGTLAPSQTGLRSRTPQ